MHTRTHVVYTKFSSVIRHIYVIAVFVSKILLIQPGLYSSSSSEQIIICV